jgi:hypothetical protein
MVIEFDIIFIKRMYISYKAIAPLFVPISDRYTCTLDIDKINLWEKNSLKLLSYS